MLSINGKALLTALYIMLGQYTKSCLLAFPCCRCLCALLIAHDHLKKHVPHLDKLSHSFQYLDACKAGYVEMLCGHMQEMLKEKDIQIAALQQQLQLRCAAFTDCRTSLHSLEAATLQTKKDLKRKLHNVKLQKNQAEQQAKEAQQKLEAMRKQLLAVVGR